MANNDEWKQIQRCFLNHFSSSTEESFCRKHSESPLEGREGVKWELGFAFIEAGKWDFLHWDWDL